MNPSRRGLSNGMKAGVLVLAIIVVVGVFYFVPGLPFGGGSQATAPPSTTSVVSGNGTVGLYSLVKAFPEMQLSLDNFSPVEGTSNTTYSYTVLGKGTINSTQYTRVEFQRVGTGHDVIMWFSPSGEVPRVDVPGQTNYTGNGVTQLPFVFTFTNVFGLLPEITVNATLLHSLTKYEETTMGIGPTRADVTTYTLSSPTAAYSALTLKLATIPANNVVIAVYVYARLHDTSYYVIQVNSLKT